VGQIRLVAEEDQRRYDHFVHDAPSSHFRQSYAWGEIMRPGSDTVRLIVEREGAILAAISLQRTALPGGLFPSFYAPGGPIIDFSDRRALGLLIEGARSVARLHRVAFMRVDPDLADSDRRVRECLLSVGFIHLESKNWSYFNYPRLVMRLTTTDGEDVLRSRLRHKHRQHISTLARKGVTIEHVSDEDGLRHFYDLMIALSVRKGFPVRSLEYYRRLLHGYGRDVRILLASHKGHYLGGILSLIHSNKCWYMHGATSDAKGNLHPAEGLHWEMIQWAKSRECLFYDLGGAGTDYPPREDNPNYGLYHFKKGFGAELLYLTGYYDLVFDQSRYRVFRLFEEKVLPLAMRALASVRRLRRKDRLK
jgi:peptidoglycan pentaglycine glycine transferase (the first glycine)